MGRKFEELIHCLDSIRVVIIQINIRGILESNLAWGKFQHY